MCFVHIVMTIQIVSTTAELAWWHWKSGGLLTVEICMKNMLTAQSQKAYHFGTQSSQEVFHCGMRHLSRKFYCPASSVVLPNQRSQSSVASTGEGHTHWGMEARVQRQWQQCQVSRPYLKHRVWGCNLGDMVRCIHTGNHCTHPEINATHFEYRNHGYVRTIIWS